MLFKIVVNVSTSLHINIFICRTVTVNRSGTTFKEFDKKCRPPETYDAKKKIDPNVVEDLSVIEILPTS